VVLSEKPPITTTIQSLPPALLETLINELSTLASVYHKPPETFLGQGRFGAEAMQKAAIEYVYPVFFGDICTNCCSGSKNNLHARILLQRPQLQLQYPGGQHLKAILRTCWILTLTVQHQHQCKNSPQVVLLASKDWQARHKEWNRQQLALLVYHNPQTTWTISWAFSEVVLRRRRQEVQTI
jgi:hypothetical protein